MIAAKRTVIEELEARGLLQDCTSKAELEATLSAGPISFYCGFDATAISLQAGNLLPITVMRWLQLYGHRPIAVLGSVTSMIGDPSGKSEERKLLDQETIELNMKGIERQLHTLLKGEGESDVRVVKNGEWLSPLSFVDFLRDVGKHVSVNTMIAKESVRARLENREQGISFTEFSYMLLQAYDYFWLFTEKNCRLQLGGSDQWGNITAGIDLIRRKSDSGVAAYGLTIPLLMTAQGTKFGKSEKGTIFLDGSRTSPYRFYQFWLNAADADAESYLKKFTFLSLEEIDEIVRAGRERPEERSIQRRLAEEMTKRVHGADALPGILRATSALFGGDLTLLSREELLDVFSEVPNSELSRAELGKQTVVDLVVHSGLAKSKGESRRLIEGGGISINGVKMIDPTAIPGESTLLHNEMLILRSGKKNYAVIKVSM